MKKVLIIDDDPYQTRLFGMVLDDCDVVAVNSPREALSLDLPTFDVVMVDLLMVEMNGIEFLKRAHDKWGARMPAAFLFTASPEAADFLDRSDTPVFRKTGTVQGVLNTLRRAVNETFARRTSEQSQHTI